MWSVAHVSGRDADKYWVTRPASYSNTHLQVAGVYDAIGKLHDYLREPQERRQAADELNRKYMVHLLRIYRLGSYHQPGC